MTSEQWRPVQNGHYFGVRGLTFQWNPLLNVITVNVISLSLWINFEIPLLNVMLSAFNRDSILKVLFTIDYFSDSQPGCRGTLGCHELMAGVPPIFTMPWSLYLLNQLAGWCQIYSLLWKGAAIQVGKHWINQLI